MFSVLGQHLTYFLFVYPLYSGWFVRPDKHKEDKAAFNYLAPDFSFLRSTKAAQAYMKNSLEPSTTLRGSDTSLMKEEDQTGQGTPQKISIWLFRV